MYVYIYINKIDHDVFDNYDTKPKIDHKLQKLVGDGRRGKKKNPPS